MTATLHTGSETNPAELDAATLYTLYALFLGKVATSKFSVPQQDAEALVQDVFVSYLRYREQVFSPRKWLVGAICNASRNYWRQKHDAISRPVVLEPERAESVSSVDELHRALAVHDVLSRLGEKCRDLLRLHYLEGYSAAEIAGRLFTTGGYAQQLLHKCMKSARRFYMREVQ